MAKLAELSVSLPTLAHQQGASAQAYAYDIESTVTENAKSFTITIFTRRYSVVCVQYRLFSLERFQFELKSTTMPTDIDGFFKCGRSSFGDIIHGTTYE